MSLMHLRFMRPGLGIGAVGLFMLLAAQPVYAEPFAEADALAPEANGDALEGSLRMDTFSRWRRTGGSQIPRTVYQAPPFRGGFFKPGGMWRTENSKLLLMPFRAAYLQEGGGLVGGMVQQRFWGNSIFSGGLEFWGLARPDAYGDFYRIEGDFGMLLWLGTQANVEVGLIAGLERDVMLSNRRDERLGFEFGPSARMTLWRFEFRADWLMRMGTERLDTGTFRHSARLALHFEPLRIGMFGLDIGGWTHFVTGGPPRAGVSAGLRIWFAVNRREPEYVQRYRAVMRD